MTGRVQHKVVVVTGAARGQGLAEARALAAEGTQAWQERGRTGRSQQPFFGIR